MKYFDRFPLVNYNGYIAKNLLTKIDFTQKTKTDLTSTFEYILDENVNRPDLISYVTYDSSYYDWLVYLTNSVVDPYHDYYKTDENMSNYIENKYSSQENARRIIIFYRNNWSSDSNQITISRFNGLEQKFQKYYSPVINDSNQVIAYKRLEEDWTVSTNKILELTVDSAEWIPDSGYISQGSTSGNIISVNTDDNTILVNNVIGDFSIGSFIQTNITNIKLIIQNIPDDELTYWEAVTSYDNEYENNELKRYISLVRNNYLPGVDSDFAEKIKE